MNEPKSSRTHQEKARAAVDKKASLGVDIDLKQFTGTEAEHPYADNPAELPAEAKEKMLGAGVILDDTSRRAGTYIQMDNMPVHYSFEEDGIEIMPVTQAMEKYDWLPDYWWKAVEVDQDKYTANVELSRYNGYFIRSLPGKKTLLPVQSCLYLAKKNFVQNVHNIIIAEEGSEMHIISGCAVASNEDTGMHLGVSEFYIKPGAKVTFTMIHSWNPETSVRPRTGVIVEENGVYMNNYILMKPVKSIQTNPLARCVGENATVRSNSVLVTGPGSKIDVGSRVLLDAKAARTEIISRAITTGGEIVSRGYIEGNAPEVKGHLECRGLILGDKGTLYAIPELKGTLAGIDLSHEAAVGKIAEEEVEYLMARGLTRDEATSAIVRGFLSVDIEGLPDMLNEELQKAVEDSEEDIM